MVDYTNFYLQVLVPGLIPRSSNPVVNIGSNFYFDASNVTAPNHITLPNKTGTLATLEDLAGLGGSGVSLATVATSGLYSDLMGLPTYATTTVGGLMSATDKTKLNGIAVGATVNSTDAFLLDRTNHTGSQAISTVSGLQSTLDNKAPVDSPTFTGTPTGPTPFTSDNTTKLATTAFVKSNISALGTGQLLTNVDKTKLDGIAVGATSNSADVVLLNRANHTGTQAISTVTGLQTALDGKAPIASPAFTGNPVAPTPLTADNTMSIATTAFVKSNLATLGSGQLLSTADKIKLDGIATGATANSPDTTLLNRANHTGTQSVSTITGLQTTLDGKAPIDSPTFTGTPVAPTPLTNDNTTKLATTAFVQSNISALGSGQLLSVADKSKLDGIASGATANSSDATLLNRANHTGSQAISTVTGLQTALDNKAPIASPAFTGVPTAPTAATSDNSTAIATTAFVQANIATVSGGSGGGLSPADRTKLDGIQAGATANSTDAFLLNRANHTGTQSISTVSGLQTALDAKAPIDSPTFTGNPVAPTPLTTDNTTSIATTAYVKSNIAALGSGQLLSASDKTKLDGIASGATANSTDAFLLNRTNHTGSQAISTVTGLQTSLDSKAPVDSPTFTGTPTGPTVVSSDNSTKLATTAFVKANLPSLGTMSTQNANAVSVTGGTLSNVTLSTAALGTPVSGNLLNCTNLPVSSGISGLGSGVSGWLADPSSANLYSTLTSKSGTGGSAVFSVAPSLSSPVLTGTVSLPTTSGSILFTGVGGVLAENNTKLYWDATNSRFGLSTVAPRTAFDISNDPLWDGITMSAVTAVASDTGGTVPAGTYYFKVVATTKGGVTAGSAETTGATITTSTGKVTLTWSAVPGATTYNIYRTTTSGTYTSPSQIGQTSSLSFVWSGGTNISGGTPGTTEVVATITNSKLFFNDLYTTTGPNYASFNFNTVSAVTANTTDAINNMRLLYTVTADNPYNHGARRGLFIQNAFGGSGTAGATIGITSNALYYGSGASAGNTVGIQANALVQGTNTITMGQVSGIVATATATTAGKVNTVIGVSGTGSSNNLGDISGGIGQAYGGYFVGGHTSNNKTADAVWGTYGIAAVGGLNSVATRIEGGYFQATIGNAAGGAASSAGTQRGVEGWAFVQSTGTTAVSEGGTFSVTNYGNITDRAHGLTSYIYNDTPNTLSIAKGLDVTIYRTSGTITTSYGIYIGTIQGTNTYGVFQADSTVKNKFSGVTSFNGVQQAITTKSSDYTVTSSDYTVLVDTTSANVTITLPDANNNTGAVFVIKKIAADNTVTINTTSSQPIDGSLTYTLTSNFSKVTVQSTGGSSWYVIG